MKWLYLFLSLLLVSSCKTIPTDEQIHAYLVKKGAISAEGDAFALLEYENLNVVVCKFDYKLKEYLCIESAGKRRWAISEHDWKAGAGQNFVLIHFKTLLNALRSDENIQRNCEKLRLECKYVEEKLKDIEKFLLEER